MIWYLLRRVANYLVLTVVATISAWVLASLVLNPAAKYQGRNPPVPQSTIDSILDKVNMNPNTPLLERFGRWAGDILFHGSLGQTVNGQSVGAQIVVRAGVSLQLLLLGTILGAILGVAFGVWGALRQYHFSDQAITIASYIIIATPVFVTGTILMILATNFNNILGSTVISFTGSYTPGLSGGFWVHFGDHLSHLLLPTISLTIGAVAVYSRYQRSAMLDVLAADYIRTARSKGLTRGKAIVRHGVRIALIPMSVYFAYSFGLILEGATVTELIFNWHGMGEWLLTSVTGADINSTAGTTAFTAILVLIAGTLSEVLNAALDPRVRK